jgi:carbon monoxide dehydrogenase subunit G
MPTTRRSRIISATPQEVWAVVEDPHHLPRWWPRVTRVEAVDDASFTEVFTTKKGRPVRADFRVVESDAPGLRRMWVQELEGTPFARFLKSAQTEVRLDPAPQDGGTEVTLEQRESPHGFFTHFGGFMMRRAARQRLDAALDSLARILG